MRLRQRCQRVVATDILGVVTRRLGLLLVAIPLGVAGLGAADLAFDGPYVSSFNRRHQRLASASGLVGQREGQIIELFGQPSRIDESPRAYVFFPYPGVPVSQVKVFAEQGRVTGVKTFDD